MTVGLLHFDWLVTVTRTVTSLFMVQSVDCLRTGSVGLGMKKLVMMQTIARWRVNCFFFLN